MAKGTVQIVIDTSALLAVLLEEPERPALIAATRGATLLAPASLPWEVGNALAATVRRRRLTTPEAMAAWDGFSVVPLRLVDVDIGEAVAAAIDLGLYAYDAYVLVLARARRLPLLTLDQCLGTAAVSAEVGLLEF
jgi:predicted nucleic acid-binding protein